MSYRIVYGVTAQEEIDKLPVRERRQILRKIERLERGLHGDIKRLHGTEPVYRLRMGNYRVLFDVEKDVIIVRRVGNRKNVYD